MSSYVKSYANRGKSDPFSDTNKYPTFQTRHITQTDKGLCKCCNNNIKVEFGWQKYKVTKTGRQEYSLAAYTKLNKFIKYPLVGLSRKHIIEDLLDLIKFKKGL